MTAPFSKDAITNEGLQHFQNAYPGEKISKEDLFYYVYGLLHSPDYRERYADNVSKELPRIRAVKTAKDSGIVNDANDWAIETMHNPKYPLQLFMRVITVSLETMKIVNALPSLDI